MGEFINPIHDQDRNDVELHNKSSFYEAVYCIKLEKFNEAKDLIDSTRKRLAYAVSTLLSENYSRAYRGIVSLQILSELEEIIDFKRNVAINNHQINESEKTPDDKIEVNYNFRMSQSNHSKLRNSKAFKNSNDITLPSSNNNNANNAWLSPQQQSFMQYHSTTSNRFNKQIAKDNLLSKWRARLKWIPKEIDVYRQILVSYEVLTCIYMSLFVVYNIMCVQIIFIILPFNMFDMC